MKTLVRVLLLSALLFLSLGIAAQTPDVVYPAGSELTHANSKELKKERKVQRAGKSVAAENKRKARKKRNKTSKSRYDIDRKQNKEKMARTKKG